MSNNSCMNWYKKAQIGSCKSSGLPSTLKNVEKTPGLVNFLDSMGFDENGNEKPYESKMTYKQRKEWNEQEHEHGPA